METAQPSSGRVLRSILPLCLLACLLTLGFIVIRPQKPAGETPVSSYDIPMPFGNGAVTPSFLQGRLSDLGSTPDGHRILDMTFDDGETSETLMKYALTFVITPSDPSSFSAGAPLSVAMTPGTKYYGYKYTSRNAAVERARKNDEKENPNNPDGSPRVIYEGWRFPGTFFAPAEALSGDTSSTIIDYIAQKNHADHPLKIASADEMTLEPDTRYLFIAEEERNDDVTPPTKDVMLTVRGLTWCGDGTVQSPEICDDKNRQSGDGCSSVCAVENGWNCTPIIPSNPSSQSICVSTSDEICDNGNDDNGSGLIDCQDSVCSGHPICQGECGDGILRPGIEECDDGRHCTDGTVCTDDPSLCQGIGDGTCSKRSGDGCNEECVYEWCGDGTHQPGLPVREMPWTAAVGTLHSSIIEVLHEQSAMRSITNAHTTSSNIGRDIVDTVMTLSKKVLVPGVKAADSQTTQQDGGQRKGFLSAIADFFRNIFRSPSSLRGQTITSPESTECYQQPWTEWPVTEGTPPPIARIASADINGDGSTDIVTLSVTTQPAQTRITLYLSDGEGNVFSTQDIMQSAHATTLRFIVTADFDGDGRIDILGPGSGPVGISLYKNTVNGFVESALNLNNGVLHSIAAADIDGDGHMDIVGVTDERNVIWYRNNGTGTFSARPTGIQADYWQITAHDFNEDGKVDLLGYTQSQIFWYRNDGNGVFTPFEIASSLQTIREIVATDADGDGYVDIVTWRDDSIVWYRNTGANDPPYTDSPPAFENARTIAASSPMKIGATDIDGDGIRDIIALRDIRGSLAWYKYANGTFAERPVTPAGQYAGIGHFAWGDMDGDDDTDIVSGGINGAVFEWHENACQNNAPSSFVERGPGPPIVANAAAYDSSRRVTWLFARGRATTRKNVYRYDHENNTIQEVPVTWYENDSAGYDIFSAEYDPVTSLVYIMNSDGIYVFDPEVRYIVKASDRGNGVYGAWDPNERAFYALGILQSKYVLDRYDPHENSLITAANQSGNFGALSRSNLAWDYKTKTGYSFGGAQWTGTELLTSKGIYKANVQTGNIEHVADMPRSLYDATAVYDPIEEEVYVFGGTTRSSISIPNRRIGIWNTNDGTYRERSETQMEGKHVSVWNTHTGTAWVFMQGKAYEWNPSELMPPTAQCGNGIAEDEEQCDDDNTTDGDGCSAACMWESPPMCPERSRTSKRVASGFAPIEMPVHIGMADTGDYAVLFPTYPSPNNVTYEYRRYSPDGTLRHSTAIANVVYISKITAHTMGGMSFAARSSSMQQGKLVLYRDGDGSSLETQWIPEDQSMFGGLVDISNSPSRSNMVLTWMTDTAILGMPFDYDEAPVLAEPLRISETSARARMAIDDSGFMAAVWSDTLPDSTDALRMQRYDRNGLPLLSSAVQINNPSFGTVNDFAIAPLPGNAFGIAYETFNEAGPQKYGIYYSVVDAGGSIVRTTLLKSSFTNARPLIQALETDVNGKVMFAWREHSSFGSKTGVILLDEGGDILTRFFPAKHDRDPDKGIIAAISASLTNTGEIGVVLLESSMHNWNMQQGTFYWPPEVWTSFYHRTECTTVNPTDDICGDGTVTGNEVCDINGNIDCAADEECFQCTECVAKSQWICHADAQCSDDTQCSNNESCLDAYCCGCSEATPECGEHELCSNGWCTEWTTGNRSVPCTCGSGVTGCTTDAQCLDMNAATPCCHQQGNAGSGQCTADQNQCDTGTSSSSPTSSVCGNGIVESGEECDDGNDDATDSCVGCLLARCGDGHIWTPYEACDDGKHCANLQQCSTDGDCTDGSQCRPRNGTGCSTVCTIEDHTQTEECDPEDSATPDCTDLCELPAS